MKKMLVWKVLSIDGLLIEPQDCGPYYDKESVNSNGGFDSEEEAIAKLERMNKAYPWCFGGDYVLVTMYSP